ncbi:MAG: T9SS type A sorting domain-containing protein [Bacteroidota bacterium]|nr:T9SS type A sorting domain-containing protein [Bacteroidota bacterium]
MRLILVFFLYFVLSTLQVFSQDTTCGIVWEPAIQLTNTSYSAYMPKIALSGDDTIHVTWVEDFSKHRLPYARCINGVWEPVIDLIKDTLTYPYRFWSNLIVTQNQSVYLFSAGEPTSQITSPREIRMHKSTDAGTSWSSPYVIGSDSSNGLFSVSLYNDTITVVYAPWKSGYSKRPMMVVSTNAGETWEKRPDTLDGSTRTALTPGTLHLVRDVFVNGAQEKLYMRSFDLGNTWVDKETLSTVDGKFSHEHCIAVNFSLKGSHLFVSWRDATACAGMVGCTIMSRESYRNGNEWNSQLPLTEEPRGYDPDAAISDDDKTVVAWTSELVFVSDHVVTRVRKHPDSSWSSIVDHTPISRVGGLQKVAITKKAVHLVWTQSVGEGSDEKFCIFYRRGVFLTTGAKEEKNVIPDGFSLSQNYPNPFNPSTKIKYEVQSTEYFSIKVYDVFGREVATLVNEKKQPGEYEVEWIADGFASGVYYYRFTIYDSGFKLRTETKKAILMK